MTAHLNGDSPDVVGSGSFRFRRFIDRGVIQHQVEQLAQRIREDYDGKEIVFVGVLSGCFMFMADLLRAVNLPCEVDFIKVSSYRNAMKPGDMHLLKDLDAEIAQRHVIIVEDIVDTGNSMDFVCRYLSERQPASLEIAAMFIKERELVKGVSARYIGMTIPDEFVIGYGLDYAQQWRYLPDLYKLDNQR